MNIKCTNLTTDLPHVLTLYSHRLQPHFMLLHCDLRLISTPVLQMGKLRLKEATGHIKADPECMPTYSGSRIRPPYPLSLSRTCVWLKTPKRGSPRDTKTWGPLPSPEGWAASRSEERSPTLGPSLLGVALPFFFFTGNISVKYASVFNCRGSGNLFIFLKHCQGGSRLLSGV